MNSMNHPGPGMQHQHQQPFFQASGVYGLGGMSSPSHGSPGLNGPQQGLLMSPRNRGSPKMVSSQFSPGGMNSPIGSSSVGASGGGTTFSSSSLNALQAISEGVGASLPSTLTSPAAAHKPDSSPSVHSSSSSSQTCKPGHGDSKSPAGAYSHGAGDQHQPLHHHHHSHTQQAESSSADRPDSQAGGGSKESGEAANDTGNSSSEPPRKIPDGKGHKKLLQLLTSSTEELGLGVGSGPSGPPTGATLESKEPAHVTSPSSTGVSSSTNQSQVYSAGGVGGGPAEALGPSHYTASLQKKHKILHKLLQNGNTPDEVTKNTDEVPCFAKITAEATGKAMWRCWPGWRGRRRATRGPAPLDGGGLERCRAPLDGETRLKERETGGSNTGPGGVSGTSDPKQEQHSPKEKKTNALLHYLLNNKDDSSSKESSDIKPKPEDLEGKAATGVKGSIPLSRGAQENIENKIKSEPPDELDTILGGLRASGTDFPEQGDAGAPDGGNKSHSFTDDGMMSRGMGMPERSPMGPAADWGMARSTGSPSVMRPDVDSYNSKGIMGGAMGNRSTSGPGSRSMLQQQLMDMGSGWRAAAPNTSPPQDPSMVMDQKPMCTHRVTPDPHLCPPVTVANPMQGRAAPCTLQPHAQSDGAAGKLPRDGRGWGRWGMMAQRNREMQMRRHRMMMLMQQQAAGGGFSPPPNVMAPSGMEGMGGPGIGQPGQQQFGYGGSYGMSQQCEPTFTPTRGPSPPNAMMQGRMGPPQNPMMQQHPQGGPMYQSPDMKGWPQGGMTRSSSYPQQPFAQQSSYGSIMMSGANTGSQSRVTASGAAQYFTSARFSLIGEPRNENPTYEQAQTIRITQIEAINTRLAGF
ncbi:Nuclear receptor coactivator 3 [Bagarius yarrelli]|uniref:Nuclear receptor coactivator 3 n=1 Tax=Bagarius yarrelli TaxID=175774 RepID=A0A556VVY4_BAGYA|nr:Nuclear receptor coactivator 3 [Bagarius yarrelli]